MPATQVKVDSIRALILALPELSLWPQVAALFPPAQQEPHLDWQLPVISCQAVGGDSAEVLPAAAAIACIKSSCILVDDILDADPRGLHLQDGEGRVANLALALLAAAFALTGRSGWPAQRVAAVDAGLARMAIVGASGQELDSRNLPGEDNYWRVVRAKGSPFYGGALEIGAVIGGAELALSRSLYDLGATMGEVVQIFDDLDDAFAVPARPDWRRPHNNLAILYGFTVDHPQRARFQDLIPKVGASASLDEAQQILIRSGAVSYCVYQLVQRHLAARRQLGKLALVDANPLRALLASEIAPLVSWLSRLGLAIPSELTEQAV